MATRNAALPWFGWWHWWVAEVERLTVELWARWIGWWCCVGSERYRQSSAMVTAALSFAATGTRASKTKRELVRGANEGRDTRCPLQHVPDHDAA